MARVSRGVTARARHKKVLKRLTEQVVEQAKVEVHPKSEGRQIMMILVPQIAK
jgi:translation initiation factor IF-3